MSNAIATNTLQDAASGDQDNVAEVRDLTKYYGSDIHALSSINLGFPRGQMTTLLGPSGCGKTTLIRCINGLIPRSYKGEISGSILLHGEDTTDWKLSAISQQIATVLQDPERQILGSKVLNEVAFGLENLAMERQEIFERVEDALDHLRIRHLMDRETFNLSGGEKQKVAIKD